MSDSPRKIARRIVDLLSIRHRKDVFCRELTIGPADRGWSRMDAWAMRCSYTKPIMWAYEVKTTRSDFVNDTKWRPYLTVCNAFYFVAPSGIIDPLELPEEAGLIVPSKNLTRLYTKKKAPERTVTIDQWFWRALLIRGWGGTGEEGLNYWRFWLAQKAEKREIGYRVAGALSQRLVKAELRTHRLEKENARLAKVAAFCEAHGINIWHWDVEREVQKGLQSVEEKQQLALRRCLQDLKTVQERIATVLGGEPCLT